MSIQTIESQQGLTDRCANRPGLDLIEQVVDSELQPDEKLARQVKLYLCHRYSGKKPRKIAERFGVSESGGNRGRVEESG